MSAEVQTQVFLFFFGGVGGQCIEYVFGLFTVHALIWHLMVSMEKGCHE